MIDTHAHIYEEYYDDIDSIIKKMKNNKIIISGTNDKNNREVIELCNKYSNCYGTIGIHPEEILNVNEESLKFIEENISNPKIVGIGEIGLDYHYTTSNKKDQIDLLKKQLEIAKKHNKAVVIHSRDAIQDTYNILSEYKELKKDIHCYSGSLEMAIEFIKIGCKLGVGGTLTFKNNVKLNEVVKNIDLKHLLLETDSPYLSPEPFRGKRNEPYNIIYVAKKISEIKNITLEEVLKVTTDNAIYQFDLPNDLC